MGTRVAGLSDRRMTPGGFTRVLSASGGCAPPGQQASVSTTQGRKGTWGTGPWPVAGLQMSPAARESRLQLRVKVTIDAPCPRSPCRIQTPCAPAVPGLVCPPSPGSAGSCTGGAPGFSGPRRNRNCPNVHPSTGVASTALSIHSEPSSSLVRSQPLSV